MINNSVICSPHRAYCSPSISYVYIGVGGSYIDSQHVNEKLTFPPERFFSFHEKIDIPSGTVFRRKIDIPSGTVFSFHEKIEMFFHLYTRSQLPVIQYITSMFSFLKNGDIHNTIRTLTGFTGLSSADSDKIKYSLLNHSTAMRRNVMEGLPIFTNIRQLEAEIETRDINSIASGRLPSAAASIAASSSVSSAFTPNDIHRDNAALALIMAKELAFLNRTIQMISLIASRYQQEQEDANWGGGECLRLFRDPSRW